MTEHFAYTFRSDLNLEPIRQKLNDLGPWKWHERDNDRWADYMSTMPLTPPPHRASVKILVDPDRHELYAVDISFESDAADAAAQLAAIRTTVLERLLPAIGARDVTRAEPYER